MNPMCFTSGLAANYGKRAGLSGRADSTLNCPRTGFTLIELLVVIAIIAILAAVLLPVLAHAKLKATQAYCLNNQKELATAWIMYVGDNKESLPLAYNTTSWSSVWPGTSDAGGFWGVNKSFPPFTGGTGTANEGAALQNIENCLMTNNLFFQYAGNVGTYHCPGDVRFTQPIQSPDIDWAYDSYAIPENVEPAEASQTGVSFTKIANIRRVADCMIFVEQADPRGYNEGTFEINVGPLPSVNPISYTDIFSMYHGDVGTFSFADGHAEAHRWHDNNIIADGLASVAPGSVLDQYSVCPVQPLQKGIDAGYLVQHCVSQTNP